MLTKGRGGFVPFKEAVMKHAPFYYDLKDVFTARASVQPKALSTNIGYDSSSDSDVNNGSSGSISISSGEDDEVVDAGDSSYGDGNSFKTPKKNKSSSKKQSSKKKKRSATTPSASAKTPSSKKKPKWFHYSAEIVVEIVNRKGKVVPIRALVDTGI